MAEAKITLSTIVNDEGLQKLNTDLAKSQTESKRLQREIRQLEKNTSDADKQTEKYAKEMADLTKKLNESRQASKVLNKQINETVSAMGQGGASLKSFLGQFKELASAGGVSSKLVDVASNLLSVKTAIAVVGIGAVSVARDISNLSNQFIAFAKNSKDATEIYNKFNDTYRNTNFEEQKIYDLGKSLMRIGLSANESADLIMKCADASASLGGGVEMAETFANSLAKVKVGGEVTNKMLLELAKAGIDLTDVQDQIQKGGEECYNAIIGKLSQFEGGMAKAKQTAGEMEGDIKGNLIEIARQTALLIDDFFGFSDALRKFYQWVIDVSGRVVNSIKDMRNALKVSTASADEYARALTEWEDIYGKDFKGTDIERTAAAHSYANACADIVAEKKAEAIEEEKLLALENKRKQVKTVTVSNAGGGSKSSSAPKNNNSSDYRELVNSQNKSLANEQAIMSVKQKTRDFAQQIALIGLKDGDKIREEGLQALDRLETQKQSEETLHSQRMKNMDDQIKYLQEHPFNGSDKILANLEQQKTQEQEIHDLKMESLDKEIELKSRLTAEAQNNNANELTTVQKYWEDYAKSISTSMGSAVASVVSGQKTMGEALKEMAKNMIANALNLLAQWVTLWALLSAFRDPDPARHASAMLFGAYDREGGKWVKKARGGLVSGAGNGYSDSVPAMLSDGEYVLRSDVVDRVGLGYLNSLNAGANPVADTNPVGGSSISLQVNTLDAESFGDFLGRGGMDKIKNAMFNDDLNFASASY